jgi:hypothetical protein
MNDQIEGAPGTLRELVHSMASMPVIVGRAAARIDMQAPA